MDMSSLRIWDIASFGLKMELIFKVEHSHDNKNIIAIFAF